MFFFGWNYEIPRRIVHKIIFRPSSVQKYVEICVETRTGLKKNRRKSPCSLDVATFNYKICDTIF